MMYLEFISASWAQKRLIEKFFLGRFVELKLMGVRVISASWAQKRLIPTF